MTQLSLKAVMKRWKGKGRSEAKSDTKQLHFRDTFKTNNYKDLNEDHRKSILESQMFLKEKIYGTIKGRCLAGWKKQRDFIPKEDSSSLTVATEAEILFFIIEAEKKRDAAVIDTLKAFIQTLVENKNEMEFINIREVLVDLLLDIDPEFYGHFVTIDKKGKNMINFQWMNAIYGTMRDILVYHKKFVKTLKSTGFQLNI